MYVLAFMYVRVFFTVGMGGGVKKYVLLKRIGLVSIMFSNFFILTLDLNPLVMCACSNYSDNSYESERYDNFLISDKSVFFLAFHDLNFKSYVINFRSVI